MSKPIPPPESQSPQQKGPIQPKNLQKKRAPASEKAKTESKNFSQHKPGSLGSLFDRLSQGDRKMAQQMLNQTLHLASIMIQSSMNHMTQQMKEHRYDV